MTNISQYDAWKIMRATSAYNGGNETFKDEAEQAFEWVQDLTEDEQAVFQAQCDNLRAVLEQTAANLSDISAQIVEEKGLPESTAEWNTQQLLSYIAGTQTKGAYAEALVTGILAVQNLAALFDLIEPEDIVVEEEEVAGD